MTCRNNPRGPLYAAAGAVVSVAACLGAIVAGPSMPAGRPAPARAQMPAVLDRAVHPRTYRPWYRHGRTFLAREEAQGGDCRLRVPPDPLSARGLATPYLLSNGPGPHDGPAQQCTMANAANLGAFVQATILEPGGKLYGYDPLVTTAGVAPAAWPPVPVIPAGSVVTIDSGFQGNIDFLTGPGARFFDQGLPGSPFGQVAFANGPAFFAAARAVTLTPAVPALGTAKDGLPCPTTRDFSLVDQDPSDNVTTQYEVTSTGQTAEQGSGVAGTLVNNGSDNLLLDMFVDPALGCAGSEYQVPSLSSPGMSEATQATDELSAGVTQQGQQALVPVNDPMTTVGADADIIPGDYPSPVNLSVAKTDAYRAGIGQPLLAADPVTEARQYCAGLAAAGLRVQGDEQYETGYGSPGGVPLDQFMAARYDASAVLLNCALFGVAVAPLPVPGTALSAPATAMPSATATAVAAVPSQ